MDGGVNIWSYGLKELVGRPERNRPLGRTRCRWDNNIRIYLREKPGEMVQIGCIWLRIRIISGSCEHRNEPSGSTRGSEFLD
jgi:hypothetical protein